MTDDTYQGWTNRETWCVALWLNNEQASQEEARAVCNTDGEMLQEAAKSLEDYFDEIIFDPDRTGMSADMLNCALARVNWQEVAQSFREDA